MTSPAFSSERLDRAHEVMSGDVASGATSGLVSLVFRRDEVHVDVIGKKDFDGDQHQRDSMFRVSAMTKPVTAAATMILIEACKLRLDDSIDDFILKLANRQVLKRFDGPVDDTEAAKRPITVRDDSWTLTYQALAD